MLLGKVVQRIQNSRVYPHVNDLLEEGFEQSPELHTLAKRVARTFTLKPLMFTDDVPENGGLAYLPDHLLFVSYDIDPSRFDEEHLFELDHVRSQGVADRVKSDLNEANSQWALDCFVDSMWAKKTAAIIRTVDDQNNTTGMVAFRRDVSVDVYEDCMVLLYSITPELVYVKPEERGKWLSTAMRRAIMEQVVEDIEKISATWNSGKIQSIAPVRLQFRVSADAYTDEGERFAALLASNMHESVEKYFTHEQLKSDFHDSESVSFDCCR